MAKDDYYVIVYKILAYLYVQLKAGEEVDPDLISHSGKKDSGKLFSINEKYWAYIIENMLSQGYIRGVTVSTAWGNNRIVTDLENCEITPAGIEYLCNNSLMEKAKQFLKDVKDITPFI